MVKFLEKRLIIIEANKGKVDFLFDLLALRDNSFVCLLNNNNDGGTSRGISHLYSSAVNSGAKYMEILMPKSPKSSSHPLLMRLLPCDAITFSKRLRIRRQRRREATQSPWLDYVNVQYLLLLIHIRSEKG